jgi:hypothetical protein
MMKRMSFCLVVALCTSLWPFLALSSQNKVRNVPNVASDVDSVARRTLDALREGDSQFLLTIVDREGISLGIDTPRMSVARFREELVAKRGVYCVIFDSSCLGKNGKDSGSLSSIREILLKRPSKMSASSKVEGEPRVRTVVVRKADGSDDVLFTLMFRHEGDNWKLEQIEYE